MATDAAAARQSCGYWRAEFHNNRFFLDDPSEFVRRFIFHCRAFANSLLSQLETGVGDNLDDREHWSEDQSDFEQLAITAYPEAEGTASVLDKWVEKGCITAQAATAFVEAGQELRYVLGYPAKIDPNKRSMVDALNRFLESTDSIGQQQLATMHKSQQRQAFQSTHSGSLKN